MKQGKTIVEKILSNHAGRDVSAGEIAMCDIDRILMHDANGPLAVKAFRSLNGDKVFDPDRVVVVFDHCTPASNEKMANFQAFLRDFAVEQGIHFYVAGRGVCHQLMVESGLVEPGSLVIGTDSHTCTYGALGSLSTGLGATDVAIALLTGKTWFKVPETVRINLNGKLPEGCNAKDIILTIIGTLGASSCNYKSVEFYGDYLESAEDFQRLTIANMLVEMGAKCGFTCHSGLGISADPNAAYSEVIDFCLDDMVPVVAKPHTVDNVGPVTEVQGTKIQQAVLGSCTNGRIEDMRAAANILRGKHVHEGVRLLVLPASDIVLREMASEGILADLINAGATICTPGCGVCVGTCGGIPADGEVVISSTNRNFKGRMGNNTAQIYLASPETVAVSALFGEITDPRVLILERWAEILHEIDCKSNRVRG